MSSEYEKLRKERDTLTNRLKQLDVTIKNQRRERASDAIRVLRNAMVKSPKLVDALAPTHACPSCTDENLSGSYSDHGVIRCPRCFLLEMMKQPTLEWHGATVGFDITLDVIDREDDKNE